MTELQRLEMELGRAYRAVRGFYSFAMKGKIPDKALLGYHCTTIGAAIRFVNENTLDGAEYFVGKPVEVLHETLASAAPV